MKIVESYPPNYKEIIKVFPAVANNPAVVFTYGDTIYAPSGKEGIDEGLKIHEEVHERQQARMARGHWFKTGPKKWWKRYLREPQFRLEQELEAYRAQYEFIKTQSKDRNILHSSLFKIANHLSGEIYGNLISVSEAIKLIKNDI